MNRVVIVGASVGGIKTAQALRGEGFTGEIVLIDAQHEAPYDKPPLSKTFLEAEATPALIALLSPSETEELGARLILGARAERLDSPGKRVILATGEAVDYDTLVIATGARARRSPWHDGEPGIHVLRTSADSERLRGDLVAGNHLLIVGAGFIGAEVAATALGSGLSVTMIDPLEAPMARALNVAVGQIFAEKHIAHGVNTIFGHTVTSVDGQRGSFAVTLSGGEIIHADAILVGIGAVPNTEWLNDSALTLDNGVLCDSALRAVGAENVFAVGDVARWSSVAQNEVIRLEHWTNAVDQARIAAHNIVHPEDLTDYETVEYVWSDQFDWKIQIVGRTGADDYIVLGDPHDDRFAVLYSADGIRLSGSVVVNWPRALIATRRGVSTGQPLSEIRDHLTSLLAQPARPKAIIERMS